MPTCNTVLYSLKHKRVSYSPHAGDEKLEASTVEFFKKQGQLGLARAVFSSPLCINMHMDQQYINKEHKHTWPPILWIDGLIIGDTCSSNWNPIEFEVLEDGRMELRSRDFYWMIWMLVWFTYKNVRNAGMEVDSMNHGHVWDMELIDYDWTGAPFKAKLFGACVGEIYVSATKRSNSQTNVFLHDVINGGDSSFDAHLVIVFDMIGAPVLMVQGSLLQDAHVCKVGLFFPYNNQMQFWKLLEDNLPPASAFIKKLIIL